MNPRPLGYEPSELTELLYPALLIIANGSLLQVATLKVNSLTVFTFKFPERSRCPFKSLTLASDRPFLFLKQEKHQPNIFRP